MSLLFLEDFCGVREEICRKQAELSIFNIYDPFLSFFEMIGFPVMGDPRCGEGNKNTAGMQLTATALEFECPFNGKYSVFNLG